MAEKEEEERIHYCFEANCFDVLDSEPDWIAHIVEVHGDLLYMLTEAQIEMYQARKTKKDDTLTTRAVTLIRDKNYEKAIKVCDKAIKLNKKHQYAFSIRGTAYLRLHQYNDAIRDCSKAIDLDQQSPYSYYRRGISFKNLGKLSKAFRDLSKAVELEGTVFEFAKLRNSKRALDEIFQLGFLPVSQSYYSFRLLTPAIII